MKFSLLYLDPPWKYNSRANHKTRFRGGAEGHYPLMTMQEIEALDIPSLAEKNCVLAMWSTFPYIDKQIQLFEHWGFRYRTVLLNWTKLNPRGWAYPEQDPDYEPTKTYVLYTDGLYHSVFFGVGYYSKSNPEVCLLGIKGRVNVVSDSVSNTILAPRREHSQKPDEAYERIERLFGDVPRLELFARQTRPGWVAAGNEVMKEDIRDSIARIAQTEYLFDFRKAA
jgi:N6-adenosine-specific RNA methylase IME4